MRFGHFLVAFLLTRQFNFLKSRKKRLIRGLTGVILILLANFIAGCFYYKVSSSYLPPTEELGRLSDLGKKFVVHNDSDTYYVREVMFHDDSLVLFLGARYHAKDAEIDPVKPDDVKRYKKKKGEARLLNEVHLYVNKKSEIDEKHWGIPILAIERLDTYNHSSSHTTGYSLLFGLATIPVVFVGVMLVALLILMMTGSSCPFIYAWNGETFEFVGEIYSGAVYPPLERHDYLPLPGLVEEDGDYKLKISNQLEEIQHTNLLELMVFNHAPEQEVLVDKYGVGHILTEQLATVSAKSIQGEDLLPIVAKDDDLVYLGSDPSKDPPLLGGVELSYNLPPGSTDATLVITAKNSYWLDFVYQNFREMLGASYKMWMKKQKDGDPQQMNDWSLSQNIPLSVYLHIHGEWLFQDFFHTVGPLAFKKDVLPIDLSGVDSDEIRIKLESGSYFWEIDYVALYHASSIPDPPIILQLSSAIDEQGNNVVGNLLEDDALYYVQPEIGNEAKLTFPVPDTKGEHTLILHSKGYYDILQEPKGAPKIRALKKIRKSGNFNKFSNDLMQEMLAEHLWAHEEGRK